MLRPVPYWQSYGKSYSSMVRAGALGMVRGDWYGTARFADIYCNGSSVRLKYCQQSILTASAVRARSVDEQRMEEHSVASIHLNVGPRHRRIVVLDPEVGLVHATLDPFVLMLQTEGLHKPAWLASYLPLRVLVRQ